VDANLVAQRLEQRPHTVLAIAAKRGDLSFERQRLSREFRPLRTAAPSALLKTREMATLKNEEAM